MLLQVRQKKNKNQIKTLAKFKKKRKKRKNVFKYLCYALA